VDTVGLEEITLQKRFVILTIMCISHQNYNWICYKGWKVYLDVR